MRKTVKSFFESIPEFKEQGFDNLSTFDELTYIEKCSQYRRLSKIQYKYTKKDGHFDFGEIRTIIKRRGTTFFKTSTYKSLINYSNKKIKIGNILIRELALFFRHSNIIWLQEDLISIYIYYINKSKIFQQIILGKVYSEETLVRCIFRLVYNIKNINWKIAKQFIHLRLHAGCSILDLNYFTKDLNKSMSTIITTSNTTSFQLLNDLLMCAIKLQEVVDFTWSEKRMISEHQRQIEKINQLEIEAKDNKPIYNIVIQYPNIKQLNCELDIYKEGSNMHNCLYTCYYDKIKNKNYIGFHLFGEQDCTFGIHKIDDTCVIDQIKTIYNGRPSTNDVQYIQSFFDTHKQTFESMLNNTEDSIFELDLPAL